LTAEGALRAVRNNIRQLEREATSKRNGMRRAQASTARWVIIASSTGRDALAPLLEQARAAQDRESAQHAHRALDRAARTSRDDVLVPKLAARRGATPLQKT
jgi:hypothetical protein